ncbi:MAG: hypothetical protein QNJ72_28585 [Pleurocapsa sp. MO_226.B13]|nr:hypothetical protein [Pleurocapsa sp. MO_226.B13]
MNHDNSKDEDSFFSSNPIHPTTMHFSLPLLVSSHEAGWNNIYLEFHRQPGGEVPKISCQKHSCQKHSLWIKINDSQGKSER